MIYWGIIKIKGSTSIEIYGNPIIFVNLEKLSKKEKRWKLYNLQRIGILLYLNIVIINFPGRCNASGYGGMIMVTDFD